MIGAEGAREGDDHGFWDSVAQSLERGAGIRPLIVRIWPPDQPGPTEEQIATLNEQTLSSNDPHVLAPVARGYRAFATSQKEVEAMWVPVLAILGSGDGFRPDVDRLGELMPRLTIRVVEGADHLSILERPELLRAIRDFLKEF